MKKLILLLLLTGSVIIGQNWHVRLNTGFNTFSMGQLADVHTAVREEYISANINANTIDEFDPSLSIGGSVFWEYKTWYFGLSYNYHSTGGRTAYKDPTGHLMYDTKLTRNSYLFSVEKHFAYFENQHFIAGLELGEGSDKVNISKDFKVSSIDEITTSDIHSKMFLFTPNVGYSYTIWKFSAIAKLGYEICIGNTYKFDNLSTMDVETAQGDDLKSEWDGLRLTLNLSYNIGILKF